MRRLPVLAFGALIAATVAAFFVTQHLKVSTPLLAGAPAPVPAVINPVGGVTCNGVDHRSTTVSFYLLHRSDDVDVYVIDQAGTIVRTLASGRHMRRGVRTPDGVFTWNGRLDDGSLAPDGVYYIRVALIHQGRTVEISNAAGPEPVNVKTVPPHPVITSVTPALIPRGREQVEIHYAGNERRGGTVRIYRSDLPGRPRLVKSFLTSWTSQVASWDGRIGRRPAPAGTYLVGLEVSDAACNIGRFPPVIPPAPGTTPHTGVTVRYLAAAPPLSPVPAGSTAVVYVDARHRRYRWSLRQAGTTRTIATGAARGSTLHIRLPPRSPGLYELSLRSGAHGNGLPLVASASGSRRARILVVLPSLTWQGQNAVDEDGDGIPDTLDGGASVHLTRPFAHGLPVGFADEAAFLSYLDRFHLPYDVTTDMGLIAGTGPSLAGHAGVVLAGSERWLPSSVTSSLRSYVLGGGRVLSLGVDSLRRNVTVQNGEALRPTQPSSVDALGARPGGLITQPRTAVIAVISDGLGIFSGTSGTLDGFGSAQPIRSVAAPAQVLTIAGTTATAPSIVGYELGRGIVVDVGLPGFGSSLVHNAGAQELVRRLWTVLGG